MTKKECTRCGCPRETMIQAKVREGTDCIYTLKWLCFPCFFRVITGERMEMLSDEQINNIRKEFMKCND